MLAASDYIRSILYKKPFAFLMIYLPMLVTLKFLYYMNSKWYYALVFIFLAFYSLNMVVSYVLSSNAFIS